jgi:predicted nucleic acid-binding protein
MGTRLLDTSILIAHWRKCAGGSLASKGPDDARHWVKDLVRRYQTDIIATPVEIEFLAGTRSSHELMLARSYVGGLRAIDAGRISEADWAAARRFAERVPRNGKRRHFGDCLIKAIAERMHCEVFSLDEGFP